MAIALMFGFLTVHPGWCYPGQEVVLQRLLQEGFSNVRCAEAGTERIYTIGTDDCAPAVDGVQRALDIIQDGGMEGVRTCRVIVTCLDMPQTTFTCRKPDVVTGTEAVRWTAAYREDGAWRQVCHTHPLNSSAGQWLVVVYPALYLTNKVCTQIYEALLEVNPAVEVPLWRGAKFIGQVIFPVYNDGYPGQQEHVRPGFVTLEQHFRLPHEVRGCVTVGTFDLKTTGGFLTLSCPLRDERFSLSAQVGLLSLSYFDSFSRYRYYDIYRAVCSVGGDFYWPLYNTQFALRYEHDLLHRNAVRGEMVKHCRYVSIGVYAEKSQDLCGGFHLSVALPPYRSRGKASRITTATAFSFGYSAASGGRTEIPHSHVNDNALYNNQWNPYFIHSYLEK